MRSEIDDMTAKLNKVVSDLLPNSTVYRVGSSNTHNFGKDSDVDFVVLDHTGLHWKRLSQMRNRILTDCLPYSRRMGLKCFPTQHIDYLAIYDGFRAFEILNTKVLVFGVPYHLWPEPLLTKYSFSTSVLTQIVYETLRHGLDILSCGPASPIRRRVERNQYLMGTDRGLRTTASDPGDYLIPSHQRIFDNYISALRLRDERLLHITLVDYCITVPHEIWNKLDEYLRLARMFFR